MYVQAGTRLDRLEMSLKDLQAQLDEVDFVLTNEKEKLSPNAIREAKAFKVALLKEISKLKKEIEKVEEEGLHGGHRSMSKECFLNDKNRFDYLGIQSDGRKYWRGKDQKYLYSWDGKSREVEVFSAIGEKKHMFVLDEKENKIKPLIKNRHAKHVR